MKYKQLYLIGLLLSIADFFVTKAIVADDLALELNPIAGLAISNFGYAGLFFLKAIPLAILLILLTQLKEESKIIKYSLTALVAIYAIVVIPGLFLL